MVVTKVGTWSGWILVGSVTALFYYPHESGLCYLQIALASIHVSSFLSLFLVVRNVTVKSFCKITDHKTGNTDMACLAKLYEDFRNTPFFFKFTVKYSI